MSEMLQSRASVENSLELMSPREIRRYISLWIDGSCERFLVEARACQEVTLAQIEAAAHSLELMEWIRLLETIDMSIEYVEALQMAAAFGCTPPEASEFLNRLSCETVCVKIEPIT